MAKRKGDGKKSGVKKVAREAEGGVKNLDFKHGVKNVGQGKAGPRMVVEGEVILCAKEGCGVAMESPAYSLCDRHEMSVRALVGAYLQPSLYKQDFGRLIASARANGLGLDWREAAEERDLSSPLGWLCAICGGKMERAERIGEEDPLGDGSADEVVMYGHKCSGDAERQWLESVAARMRAEGAESGVYAE